MQFIEGVCRLPVTLDKTLLSSGDRPDVEKSVLANSLVTSVFLADTDVALMKRIAGKRRTDFSKVFMVYLWCKCENCAR